VAHQAFIEQVEKSINQSYEDDLGVNKAIETFLDTIEYVLFFPISYGVNLLVDNGCQESSFADDEQTTSSASFYTNIKQNNAEGNGPQPRGNVKQNVDNPNVLVH
jgi:hypothetical protein